MKANRVRQVLAVSSLGDPKSERVWSRFPKNLLDACRALDSEIHIKTYHAKAAGLVERIIRSLDRIFGYKGGNGFFWRTFLAIKVSVQIQITRPDFVIYFGTDCVPWMTRIKPCRSIVIIDSVQEQWTEVSSWWRSCSPREWKKLLSLEHNAIEYCDYVFCLTSRTQSCLKDVYGLSINKVILIGTGLGNVEIPNFSETYQIGEPYSRDFIITTVARQRILDKGLDLLVDAIEKLNQRNNINLIVFGSPVDQYASSPFIKFYDSIDLNTYYEILKSSDLFAMPARFEPYGLAFLDAAIIGLPILATKDSGIAEEMADFTEVYICQPNSEQIAETICELMSMRDVSMTINSKNRDMNRRYFRLTDSRFDWSKAAAKLLEITDSRGVRNSDSE